MELNEEGTSYIIKSTTNRKSVVDLKVTKAAPGFVVGKRGTTYYGTDLQNPWGRMRHAFWPRCTVEGSIMTQAGEVNFKGRGFFAHALQGMKPHHAGESSLPTRTLSILSDQSSRQMELCQFPVPDILCSHDGIHDTSFIRIDSGECWRYRS